MLLSKKKRGNKKIGTYTDIYSLGLIINVLFTKEIPQGEEYKKIWQYSPVYSFLDSVVEQMIVQDISKRENDIRNIIIEFNKYDKEYNVEKSLLNKALEGKSKREIEDILNLYNIIKYSFKNIMNWNEIDIEYHSDYIFRCNDILKNSIFMNYIYKKIVEKFEYEANAYNCSNIPYEIIDFKIDKNKELYKNFTHKIDSMPILNEVEDIKSKIKKYFCCLCDYHAKEFYDDLKIYEKTVNEKTTSVPILYIANFINMYFPYYKDLSYVVEKYIIFEKHNKSYIKNNLFINNDIYDKIINYFSNHVSNLIFSRNKDKLVIATDKCNDEQFIYSINNLAYKYDKGSINRDDILDIINCYEENENRKLYYIDNYQASLLFSTVKLY